MWPSERIPMGGVFQPAKARYSPERQQFIKTLINESKFSMMTRKKENYFLRSGEPPSSSNKLKSSTEIFLSKLKGPKVLIRPGSPRRRSYNDIVKSGAYEREKFIANQPRVDREKVKKHLQDVMAFGKDVDPNEERKKKVKKKDEEKKTEINRFDELEQEIKEREEWLREMERLGEGEKYRLLIQQQIQARVRQMKKLKPAPEKPIKNNQKYQQH